MSKLLSYLIPGLVVAAILALVDIKFVPSTLHNADWFNHLMSVLYFACVIVPCVIYFIRNPPGHGAGP